LFANGVKHCCVMKKEYTNTVTHLLLNFPCALLYSRRLFQQFLVDAYSMIESWRLKWYRDHQKEVRADMYRGLAEAVLRGETSTSSTGKRIVLPSKFVGGARYMIQNYQDAMAICAWVGFQTCS